MPALMKPYTPPQAFETMPRPLIVLAPLEKPSNQIATRGYDPATQTLALTFTRGNGAIYCYPGFTPEQWAAFLVADSAGGHFGKVIKPLAFKKFPADPAPGDSA